MESCHSSSRWNNPRIARSPLPHLHTLNSHTHLTSASTSHTAPPSTSCTTSAAPRQTQWASRHAIRARPGNGQQAKNALRRAAAAVAAAKKGTCVHALLTCTLAPQPHARTHAWMHSMHDSARASQKNAPPQQLVRKVRPLAFSVGVASLARLCSSLAARGLVRGGAYAYGGGVGRLLLMLVAAGRWYIAGCVVRCRFFLGSRCWHVQVRF